MTSSVSAARTKRPYAVGEGISLASVQRRELAARLPRAGAQPRGLEPLELRAEPQQLAVCVADAFERDDRPSVVVDARIARQPAPDVRVDPHGHGDARPVLL